MKDLWRQRKKKKEETTENGTNRAHKQIYPNIKRYRSKLRSKHSQATLDR
jgi:hypothetical protein